MAHPDSDLFPHATGLAKATVDKHTTEQSLKLYAGWFCPFVQRTWTVLEEKGIPYQYIEVNPYHKPESLMKLNPRGLVPTLQYDNKPLYESIVVGEFLEDAYPDHGLKMLPSDPYQRAVGRIWTDFVTSRVIPSFHRFLQFQPSQSSKPIEELRADFLNNLRQFAEAMEDNGPFFFGKEPSLVDFAMAPWATRLWLFDHFKSDHGGLGAPAEGKGGEHEKNWSRWRKWLAAIEERPSIKGTTSEREKYLSIYQRYADDTAQSELAKATREGKGVP